MVTCRKCMNLDIYYETNPISFHCPIKKNAVDLDKERECNDFNAERKS